VLSRCLGLLPTSMQNSRQFHILPEMVHEDSVTVPIGAQYRQMTSVLRLHVGDDVRFFDGAGSEIDAQIIMINKDGILAKITGRRMQVRETRLVLALGVLKNDRMRWALEKATELGVSAVIPMISERVVKRPSSVPARWHSIVREAAEQSGRAWLPEIREIRGFRDILEDPGDAVICVPGVEAHIRDAGRFDEVTVFIGPEGGFSGDELRAAESKWARAYSLGEAELRADTAVVVALAFLGG